MKRLTYALFLTIMLFGYNAYGQVIPCEPDYDGTIQRYKTPNKFPQFYTDMPYDVMIAYIAMDSVAKNAPAQIVDKFIDNLTFSDTLKYLAKYFYAVDDYDPLLFSTYRSFMGDNYKSYPFYFLDNIEKRIRYMSPLIGKHSLNFFASQVIAHIKLIDSTCLIDPQGEIARTKIHIGAYIIDKIKGKNLHTAFNYPQDKRKNLCSENEFNNVVYFTYFPDHPLIIADENNMHTSRLFTGRTVQQKYGNSLIQTNKEYIVFLDLTLYCKNTGIQYFDYYVSKGFSENLLVFPIENGIVQDEADYFGFGQGLTVDQFKAKLKERIQQIKDMRY